MSSANNNLGDDIDPIETEEWRAALQSVIQTEGDHRAKELLSILCQEVGLTTNPSRSFHLTTPYHNTIAAEYDSDYPGDIELEKKIESWLRWNAMAMVVKAGKVSSELGGHIASYASSAVLYEVGFQHFWRAPTDSQAGDLIFYQGHSSPGIYARSYLEGRFDEERLLHFRQEIEQPGLSSYPHPWLMPEYWQFPTVSMGLGPIQAIYQARLLKYLEHRKLIAENDRKVWCFCGDGEMDEPESLGALSIAAREQLNNLIFVINCNLQRLDGPVRGNGKIIQELESIFHGAGWRVIKVLWGEDWDHVLTQDVEQRLIKALAQLVDGAFQSMLAQGGAGIRAGLIAIDEQLQPLLAAYSDSELQSWLLGGHCRQKVYSAYCAACQSNQPVVILAQTIKGFGLGPEGHAQNPTHQLKKLDDVAIQNYRDRLDISMTDQQLTKLPFFRPDNADKALGYLHERRQALGGYLPQRRRCSSTTFSKLPEDIFQTVLQGSGKRQISTTMAFVRIINTLLKHPSIGRFIVPIIPDEARTFGMEGMFRQYGIYSPLGQLYDPVDHEQIMSYKESRTGQILEEGINEAGAFCSWLSAATAYSNHNLPLIPFFIFYSMFGFQRIGDLIWAAGDSQARGFLLGATAGRTTLAGEGLQHQDGHSLLFAATIPNCVSYDPTFGYELAVIMQDGFHRMYHEQQNVFYYLTVMNENYHHPAKPEGCEEGILKGIYQLSQTSDRKSAKILLLGSGTILLQLQEAAALLAEEYQIHSELYSVTSFNELRREALLCERWNQLHPKDTAKIPYVSQILSHSQDKIVLAATDYMRLYADQIRAFVPGTYVVLGTDGFGRSDTRQALRKHFEVDVHFILFQALSALYQQGKLDAKLWNKAKSELNIDVDRKPSWQL